jgi:hypothetical protein
MGSLSNSIIKLRTNCIPIPMVSTQHEFIINSFVHAVKNITVENITVAATKKSRIACPSRKLDPDPGPNPEPKPYSACAPKHYFVCHYPWLI